MDHYLFGLLQYQMLNGNKVSDGFMVKAWIEMVKLFNGKFGLTITKMLSIDTNIWGSNVMIQIMGCLEIGRNSNLWDYV